MIEIAARLEFTPDCPGGAGAEFQRFLALPARLASIKILYRRPDTMTLYGVPYLCEPRLLFDRFSSDWVYLGTESWYYGGKECKDLVDRWLAPLRLRGTVPDSPGEYSEI
jgi:hypothetical protein